jgi:hypothetical protein
MQVEIRFARDSRDLDAEGTSTIGASATNLGYKLPVNVKQAASNITDIIEDGHNLGANRAELAFFAQPSRLESNAASCLPVGWTPRSALVHTGRHRACGL